MLFLLLELGGERYALDTSRVVEVLPLLDLREIPHAPGWIAGLFDYHGELVPVVDLSLLMAGSAVPRFMSSRIVLTQYGAPPRLLGVLAGQATSTLRAEADDFEDSGVQVHDAPYLGGVRIDASGMVQWIYLENILSPEAHQFLFQPEDALP